MIRSVGEKGAETVAEQKYHGQVALVTGSSRGLGRVIAARLLAGGARVIIHGTTPQSGSAFGEGSGLQAVAVELATQSGGEVAADLLVNNAGGDIGAAGTSGPRGGKPQPNDAVFIPMPDVRAVLERNLFSCIMMCKAVAPEMMERRSGRIVNIGSIAGSVGREDGAIYCVSKAGTISYTRCLAAQLRPYDVAANVVSPGLTMTARIKATRDLQESKMVHKGTLERYGWPEEIANAVDFFLDPANTFITGQVLRVDGGGQLWPA